MSSQATPITPQKFAAALRDLPLSSLHLKKAELLNSMQHLQNSNEELHPLAVDGDKDCAEAIWENLQVIKRMQERLDLLKAEVEGRGFLWDVSEAGELQPGQLSPPEADPTTGHELGESGAAADQGRQEAATSRSSQGGTLNDEELARRLAERMDEDQDDGVHL